MSNDKTGGPAFPASWNPDTGMMVDQGMTLRDYFAAKAMAAVIASNVADAVDVQAGETVGQYITRKSYAIADAMLAAREVKP